MRGLVDLDEDIETLVGKTFERVEVVGRDEIRFINADGSYFILHHAQDCCETVEIEDMEGDLADLAGTPILKAEAATSDDLIGVPAEAECDESHTWTFYKFATIKGHVDVRWFGTSNGYYSESVDFGFVPRPGDHLGIYQHTHHSVKAGDRVLCRNGHHVCDVVMDIDKAPINGWGGCFGNWQQKEPEIGDLLPLRCEQCGSVAIA